MTSEKKVEEATTMAGGAVSGGASKDFMVDRKKFLEELSLRESIRKIALKSANKKKVAIQEQEQILRKAIRNLILEVETDRAPYPSTAINFLEELLKRILPTIEQDYKSLTTKPEQRESFRAHFISSVENILNTISLNMEPPVIDKDKKFIGIDEEVEIEIDDEDDEESDGDKKFIDIEQDDEKAERMTLDTGSKLASQTFDSVEKQISETFGTLSDENDQKTFEDYLITNLKLYFDKYEEELVQVIEPTTKEYEEEVEEQEEEEREELDNEV